MALANNERGKGRYTADYSIRDIYKAYKEDGGKLPYSLFRDVYETFISNVMYHIVEQSASFRMYSRLGDITIHKKKIEKFLDENGELQHKYRAPNWQATLELWNKKYGTNDKTELKKIPNKPLVYHDNEHTNGYTFYINWDKRTSNVKNQKKYLFIASRDFSRAVSKIQKQKKVDYYEQGY